jgi:tetratricopeptide (TPR) repeat protein
MAEEPVPPTPKADEPEALTASAWLKELAPEQSEPEKTERASLASDWGLELPASEESPEPDALDSTVPNWLQDLSAEVEQKSKEEVAPRAMEEKPDWLDDLRMDTASTPAEKATVSEPENESAEDWKPANLDEISKLDWLEELAPKPADETAQPEPEAWVPEPELAPSMSAEPAAEVAVSPSPQRTASLKAAEEAPQRLEQARQALNYSKYEDAADHYGFLLRRRAMLDEVIADLSAAVRRNPANATLWQTLGDAYMRNNQLREALDSYTKAEDLL